MRIWKRYVLITDTGRVRKYIWIQSLHYLTFKATRSENNDVTNITIELENLRQITVAEKQKYDYFVVQA